MKLLNKKRSVFSCFLFFSIIFIASLRGLRQLVAAEAALCGWSQGAAGMPAAKKEAHMETYSGLCVPDPRGRKPV